MTNTAQGNELKSLVEECKEILETNFREKLNAMGIQLNSDELIPLDETEQFLYIESDEEKEDFKKFRNEIHNAIKIEVEVSAEDWSRGYYWFVDRMVYTFLNKIFAVRILEALGLLNESTLVPQEDLGNISARMKRIQEKNPNKMSDWNKLMLQDVFQEIGRDIQLLFSENDIATKIWPDNQTIEYLIQKLNSINPEIFKAEDCIGWFYHYYVLKNRKEHKTMSSHGSKSPANPYYLSILNTVYTPRWMVQILVDNSLGHWWQDQHPDSNLFKNSPFFINKVPIKLPHPTKEPIKLRILDPACGSGNFLIYTFRKLVEIYHEYYPTWSYSKIITTILKINLFGIDINRRPAQLSALALYITAKTILKENDPEGLTTFKMPPINIICCDIRIPKDKNRILFIQQFKDRRIQKILKDVIELFDNADQLGSLIDVRNLQNEINEILKLRKKEEKSKLDSFIFNKKPQINDNDISLDLVKIIDTQILNDQSQNVGFQLFGKQAKSAATLAQILMRKYDIIMANPPFGLSMNSIKDKLKRFYPDTYGDLISAFIDQSLRLLKINGYISMVTDYSFLHLPKFERFRINILINKSFIQYMILTGEAALPDAANKPNL
ncbi:MAG: Eco57I restriction-modification methylase domain-containing protein, partial [Promethearchaeota archaeon]